MTRTATKETFPPGPKDPGSRQVELFEQDPFGYVEAAAREHGPLFTLELGKLGSEGQSSVENNGNWVFLTRPHQLKLMYTASEKVSSGAMANRLFFGTDEESVGYIDGKAHRKRRGQLHPALSGGRDYVSIVQGAVDRSLAQWPRDREFELFPELQKLTSEVIVEVVCGNFSKADQRKLASLLPMTENARYTLDEVLMADSAIRAFVEERIDGHLELSDRLGHDDLFASLLRHAAEGDGSLSDIVVRDEVFSTLYTGFATTANTLSWAFTRILGDDRVRRKLMREFGDRFRDRPLTRDHFAGLEYLEATIMETLRLHPVSALNGVRMLVAPLEIDGYRIPAGTILVHCAYLLQRSSDLYPDPLEFAPERFVDNPVDQYVFGAFGGGHRMCVGRGYAREEMKMVLPIILSALQLELGGELPGAKKQGFFMAPENGVPCTVTARE